MGVWPPFYGEVRGMKALALRAIPVFVAAGFVLAVALWLSATPSYDLTPRLPAKGRGGPKPFAVAWPGEFEKGEGQPADSFAAWPQFRGPDRSAVAPNSPPLARSWPEGGPPVVWEVDVGIGYAAPAVQSGRVYLLDYDKEKQADVLRCLSLADGREIWRRWYKIPIVSDHGISRTVPAVTYQDVVTLGPKCHVMCCDATTGDFRWGIDLVKKYGTTVPKWYAGQCPLIDMGKAILAPGGPDVLMMAVDCQPNEDAPGKPTVAWTTPNPHGWKMTHSSIVPMEFADRRMYIYCASGGVVGVAAADSEGWKAGDVLWETSDWQVRFANAPSPVVIGNGHVLLSGGYGSGSMMIRVVEKEGGGLDVKTVWRLEKSKQFGSEQQTPVFYNGHVYGVLPKEAGALAEQLICMDLTGKHLWSSGREHRFGLGPYMIADGLLFAINDDGVLTMAEATSEAFKPIEEAEVLPDGHETWGPPALVDGRLLVRDLKRLRCLDLREPKEE